MSSKPMIQSTLSADPVIGELVQSFVEEVPNRLESLRSFAEAEDWEMLQTTAHQLKGAFGGYGFESLMEPAQKLEAAVRDRESECRILQAFDELTEMCQRMR